MPAPDKNQKIQTFKNNIAHDQSIILDISVNDAFITSIIQQVENCSLRDVKLIIDTAKMFKYAEKTTAATSFPIILAKTHFQRALDQLRAESQILQETFSDRFCKTLQPWGVVFAIAANGCVLLKTSYDFLKSNPKVLKKIQSLCYTTKNLFNNNIIPSTFNA